MNHNGVQGRELFTGQSMSISFFCLISPSTNHLALGESNSFKSRHENPKEDHANNVVIQQSPNVQQQCKFRKCPH